MFIIRDTHANKRHQKKLWENRLEFLSLALFALIGVAITIYYNWAVSRICPIADGNNCVSRTSNLGLLFSRGQFQGVLTKLQAEPNNFLSVVYFSLASAILGPGRLAWGWAWLAGLTGFSIFQIQVLKSKMPRWQVVFSIFLILVCSSILSQTGGLLDQRFDVFAIFWILSAAGSLIGNRIILALYLSIIAVFAKGPAVPLIAIFWITAFCARVFTFRQLKEAFKKCPIHLLSLVALLVIYKIWFLKTVVSYNLVAVPGQDQGLLGVVRTFLTSSLREILHSRGFYLKSLYHRAPFFLILLFLGMGLLIKSCLKKGSKENQKNRSLLLWGFSLTFFTYLLFSSHPVKSAVLDLWFLPGLWILSLVVANHLKMNDWIPSAGLLLITVKLASSFYLIPRTGPYLSPSYQQYWVSLQTQAKALGRALSLKPNIEQQVVRLVPNFLSHPENGISLSYDTYRVLLLEQLGRQSPIFEGWELATFSDAWQSELKSITGNEWQLALIVTEGSDQIHFRHHANQLASDYIKEANPACEIRDIEGSKVPRFGSFHFFLTDQSLKKCL